MKKIFSFALSILMCLTVFSGTVAEVAALGTDNGYFTVRSSGYKNDKIIYKIALAPDIKSFSAAVVKVEFDSDVLEVASSSGAAGTFIDGEFVVNVSGIYENGLEYDQDGTYVFAFMNPNGVNIGSNGKDFLEITLKAISKNRPKANVKIYCEQFFTDDSDDSNDVKKGSKVTILKDSFDTLCAATNKEVVSTDDGLKFSWNGVVGAKYYDIYRKKAGGEWKKLKTVDASVTEYEDTSITKGIEYYYSVATRNDATTHTYDTKGVVGLNFGTINQVSVTEVTQKGLVVEWEALTGAESYSVYRKAEGEKEWLEVAKDIKGTSYESTNLVSGKTYYYKVRAIKGNYTADTVCEPASKVFISTPEIAYVQITKSSIIINWSMIKGAGSYCVYRKAPGETSYKGLEVIEGNAYEDKDVADSKTYSYKVRAIGSSSKSAASSAKSITKIPVTSKVTATLGVGKVTVSWKEVSLADSYIVYRNSEPIATVDASKTSYSDKSVESGKTYTYAVATCKGDIVTDYSTSSSAILYLDSPVVKSVTNTESGVKISFNKVASAKKYVILRKTVGGKFAVIKELDASSGTSYVDKTAESGVQYVYGVKAVSGDTVTAICESKVICSLTQPKIKSLKLVYNGVQIKWGAVAGAEKYKIWQKDPTKEWTAIATVSASTLSYIHKTPKEGRNNFYFIQAICGDNKTKTPDSSTKCEDAIFVISAPKITFIENASTYVTLRWSGVDAAESYKVYRRKKGSTTWSGLATVTTTSYKDKTVKSGVSYEYTVKAFDGYDLWSAYNTDGWGITFVASPVISSVKNVVGGVKVSWGKVSGATKYMVYRKKANDSDWTKIKTVTTNSYTDKSVSNNTTYYYTVKAYYSGTYSYSSETGKQCSYLAAPTVSVDNGSDSVKVSWNKIGGAAKYIVYRKAGSATSWTKVATVTSTSYFDKNVKNKTSYKYAVKAYKNSSCESGYNTSGVKTVFLKTPKTATATSGKTGITVKWSQVSNVSGYVIYRKTGSGEYEKLATVKGASKVSYLDKSAQKGKTYTYRVVSYYSSYKSYPKTTSAVKDKY